MLSTLDQALTDLKEMAVPVPEKQRASRGSKWGDGTPEDPLGAGRWRGMGDGGRGVPSSAGRGDSRTWQGQAPAGLEQGLDCLCPERPGPPKQPAAARNSPAVATAPLQPVSQKRSALRGAGSWGSSRPRPTSSPSAAQSREADAADGGVARWAVRDGAGLGAGPGRGRGGPGALTTLLRAGNIAGLGPAAHGAAFGLHGRRDHAGYREDFPPASGRLGVGGR